ncbi:MAG: response regulator [Phycisphaerae bacterium]
MATILLVEGNARLAARIGRHLRERGHRATIVPNSEMAAALVFTIKPDLIALDIDSPVYCGLDFHELLQMNQRGRDMAVLYLSSSCTWVQRENVARLGAEGLVSKSGDAAVIAERISEFVPIPEPSRGTPVRATRERPSLSTGGDTCSAVAV